MYNSAKQLFETAMHAEGKIDDCTEVVLEVHDKLHQQRDDTKQALQLVVTDTMAQ